MATLTKVGPAIQSACLRNSSKAVWFTATVHCGSQCGHWPEINDGVERVMSKPSEDQEIFEDGNKYI